MDKNEIIVEVFDGCDIRVVIRDNEPWFVAKDVCEALGCKSYRSSVNRLDEDEKCLYCLPDSMRRIQKTIIVNEFGLYLLIIGSRKPSAHKFRKWVTSDVLPSIRKTGAYSLDDVLEKFVSGKEDFELTKDSKVYIVQEGLYGPVKIGVSSDVESRIKTLQTGNSNELRLLAVIDSDNAYFDESNLHKKLSDYRVRGEWFEHKCLDKI